MVQDSIVEDSMEQAHQDLLQQVTALSQRVPSLASRLSAAASQFQEAGIPLASQLLEELNAYRQAFANLSQKALDLGKLLPSQRVVTSVKDLEELVQAVVASGGKEETREQALRVLDRVLTIVHSEQSNFPPLQSCHEKARELHRAISTSPTGALHPNAKAVAEGKHPVATVLTLVEHQGDLDDDLWVSLEEEVAAAFGKQLAVAISRGKLSIPAAKPAGPAAPSPAPAPITPSDVIVIPAGKVAAVQKPTADPDVVILESQSPASRLHEVIIVPAVETTKATTSKEHNVVFGEAGGRAQAVGGSIGLKVLAHLEGVGDRVFAAEEYAGTRGQGRRLEAFQINIDPPVPGLSLRYMAHVSGIGDTPWVEEGQLAGARGQARRVEGFAIELTGPGAANYDVLYMGHIQNVGDTSLLSNGQYCGTRGKALRVEGMRVWIKPKA